MRTINNPTESGFDPNQKLAHYTRLFEIQHLPRLIELLEYRNRIVREYRASEFFVDAIIQTNDLIKQYLNLDATK